MTSCLIQSWPQFQVFSIRFRPYCNFYWKTMLHAGCCLHTDVLVCSSSALPNCGAPETTEYLKVSMTDPINRNICKNTYHLHQIFYGMNQNYSFWHENLTYCNQSFSIQRVLVSQKKQTWDRVPRKLAVWSGCLAPFSMIWQWIFDAPIWHWASSAHLERSWCPDIISFLCFWNIKIKIEYCFDFD